MDEIARVFVGAGIGGVLRYVLGGWITDRGTTSFPWHTFAINVGGAFLLGILMALTAERGFGSMNLRLFLGVGILGGFTTFSTLSVDSIALVERGLYLQGMANMFGSAAIGLLAAVLGLMIGRSL